MPAPNQFLHFTASESVPEASLAAPSQATTFATCSTNGYATPAPIKRKTPNFWLYKNPPLA
jgi:hypothetical protein